MSKSSPQMKTLREKPSLEQFRKLAKDLRKSLAAGNVEAISLLRDFHPVYSNATVQQITAAEFSLRDAQLVLAREYKFENWADLKEFMTWDVAVQTQDLEGIREALREKPERVRQDIRRPARYGFVKLAPISFCNNNPEMMELLLRHGAKLNVPGESVLDNESTPEFVDFAAKKGADLNAKYYYQGETPLHFAAACGDEEMIQLLLDHGADISKQTAKNETPLDYAKRYGRPESIQRLLESA